MAFFHDFNAALWEIFCGNLLMLATSMFYIGWWTVSFRPNRDGKTSIAGYLIAIAAFAGLAAIIVTSLGIYSLSHDGNGSPVLYILLGAVAFFIIFLIVTKTAFHRVVTSELLLVTVWAALELSVIAVLLGSG